MNLVAYANNLLAGPKPALTAEDSKAIAVMLAERSKRIKQTHGDATYKADGTVGVDDDFDWAEERLDDYGLERPDTVEAR